MRLVANITGFLEDAREWSRGRSWPPRLLMWVWMAWMTFHCTRDAAYSGFTDGLNLGVHEFGHLICAGFGQFGQVLGGSLVQCLVPVISFLMFYRQEDYFAFSFSLVWLGTNLHDVARYVGDARAMQLDLVSPFGGDGEIIHDWNWLLAKFGWLGHDHKIAAAMNGLAITCLWAGVAWGAYILWRMIATHGDAVSRWQPAYVPPPLDFKPKGNWKLETPR